MLLAKEQRLGALIVCGLALAAWFVAALFPRERSLSPDEPSPTPSSNYRSWEERKDSMRRADSLRYAQWSAEREQRYDSFRMADQLRREEWKKERQLRYDSFRIADSIWRDSVGWQRTSKAYKDTIIDLNHTDTTGLQLIRGIGAYKARQIISYREQLGGYYSPTQLKDAPLESLALDTLLHHFTADSSVIQKIPVNSSGTERLRQHPYLRYAQAKAIYELRRRRVRLRSIDDLRAIPSLTAEETERLRPYLSFEQER